MKVGPESPVKGSRFEYKVSKFQTLLIHCAPQGMARVILQCKSYFVIKGCNNGLRIWFSPAFIYSASRFAISAAITGSVKFCP